MSNEIWVCSYKGKFDTPSEERINEYQEKYHHNRVVEQLQAEVERKEAAAFALQEQNNLLNQERDQTLAENKALREGLELASEVIDIATDWNAPSYYDVSIPEKLKETLQDKESDEPEWLCVYKFMSYVRQTLKGNE